LVQQTCEEKDEMELIWLTGKGEKVNDLQKLKQWKTNHFDNMSDVKNYFLKKNNCHLIITNHAFVEELLEYLLNTFETAKICVVVNSKKVKNDGNLRHSLLMNGATLVADSTEEALTFSNEFYKVALQMEKESDESKMTREYFYKMAKIKLSKPNEEYKIEVTDLQKKNIVMKQTSIVSPIGTKKLAPKKVYELFNSHLTGYYYLRRLKMINVRKEEDWVFHGTDIKNIDSINSNGLYLPQKPNQPGKFGAGCYFAPEPTKSLSYVTNGNMFYMCRIAIEKSDTKRKQCSLDEPFNTLDKFDSSFVVGDPDMIVSNNIHDEIVIFHPAQARPKYLIEYNVINIQPCTTCRNVMKKAYKL
jgi:hypothetical protein